MKYLKTKRAVFIDRPNRFIAHVRLGETIETVHVKNTGRCRELLLPGVEVVLSEGSNPKRKTKYDLIAVNKEGTGWINIDSQAPNAVMKEWLEEQDFDFVKPEYVYGASRVDFYMEKGKEKYLCEVKGCTLEENHQGYFPDAPTERGVKHLHELIGAVKHGFHCSIAFVIQINGVETVLPSETDPDFARALSEAEHEGVNVLFMRCSVTEDELYITGMSVK